MITITQKQLDELDAAVVAELDRLSGGKAAGFLAEQIDEQIIKPLGEKLKEAGRTKVAEAFDKLTPQEQDAALVALKISK